ncbi:MAG: oligosaccharide flippase family protein, partial [Candidatus Hydrothermarchaeota archaeon]
MKLGVQERLKGGSLLGDSSILISATLVGNVFNYLFQVYVGRALGPVGYGAFGALISVLYILLVPTSAISLVVAKFVSEYSASGERDKISSLIAGAAGKTLKYGLGIFLILLLASGGLAEFLQIPSGVPVIILAFIFLLALLLSVLQGVLQGLQRFWQYGLTSIIGALSKLLFGFILIYIGLGVNGAISSLLFSNLVLILVVSYFIRTYIKRTGAYIEGAVLSYSTPALLAMTSITVISNVDMVLVKHFFTPSEAGYYAAAALFGKIIIFVSAPIAFVLFPKASRSQAPHGGPGILRESLLFTLVPSLLAVAMYFIAPDFVISLVFGSRYTDAAPLIGLFGIGMTFYSLSNILITYDLAVKKMEFLPLLLFTVLAETALILLFPTSLLNIVWIVVA